MSKHLLWDYRLAEDVCFVDKQMLVKKFPLRVYQLNKNMAKVLELLQEGSTIPAELIPKVANFAEKLADNHVLVRKIPDDVLKDISETLEETPAGARESAHAGSEGNNLFISIVIPIRDRPREIELCLKSIFNCQYPKDKLEVIVVDDASTDGETVKAIKKYPVTLIELPENKGQSACRNLGVSRAKGDIIAFTDSDCEVSKNWLWVMSRCFQDPEVAFVGGGVYTNRFETSLDYYEEGRSPLLMGEQVQPVKKKGVISYVPTCNLLIRKYIFTSVGGFNQDLRVGEDVDLLWRVLEGEHKGWYVPEGYIWHHHRNQLYPFLKRRAQYAGSEAMLNKNHGGNLKKILFIPTWQLPFILGVGLSVLFSNLWLAVCLLVLMFILEFALKSVRLKSNKLDLSSKLLINSIWQSYGTTFRFATGLLTRYYLWLLLTIAVIFPTNGWWILMIPVISTMLEYRKEYRLSFSVFTTCYLLEMFAYSVGFLYGCLKQKQYRLLIFSVNFR